MNVEFIQHPYPTSPIFIKCLIRKVNFRESKVIKCMNIICIKFNFLIAEPWLPSSTWSGDKNHVRACVFSVFGAVKILNGYSLSGWMERAQDSDSMIHVKGWSPTSRTEIGQQSLYYLF